MHILKNVTIRKNSLLILLIQGTGNNFTGSVCLPTGWSNVVVSPEDGGKTDMPCKMTKDIVGS